MRAAAVPRFRAALDAILDRRERTGRMPRSIQVDADAETVTALREVFTADAVVVRDGRARLDLTRLPARVDLERMLYAGLDRVPRDPIAERSALQSALVTVLSALAPPVHPIARDVLADELAAARSATGDTWNLAEERGAAHAGGVVADVVAALGAVFEVREPIRIANFAARVLGDSKALAPGGERARRLGAALLAYDLDTQAEVAGLQPRSPRHAELLALEARGLFRDDASVLVHAFGPLVYRRGDAIFDHVSRHAVLGDPTPLSLRQLRGAELVELPVERITLIEGQATFLDYVDRADARRELVVLAGGQASWAVVVLLRMCAGIRPRVRHFGDLDRSGILILRSLARRSGLTIEPWHMDAATHRRFAIAHGRVIDRDERGRLARLVAIDDASAMCHDLLLELHKTGMWIEQETFADIALVAELPHLSSDTTGV
ncbi:MAG TPA: DUF2399 domain-containing protein [Kofleriaceae bacterium]